MPDKKKLLKEIESALYRSLTQKTNDLDLEKFSRKFDDEGMDKEELVEVNRLFNKFNHNNKLSEKFSEVFDELKEKIGETQIFAYGFYNNSDKIPLYIGRTGNGSTRLNQHFQMYSSAFMKFPMRFLDVIKIWRSDTLTKANIKLFESFLINRLSPHFNKQRPKKDFKKEKEGFHKLLEKFEFIPVSNHKNLFKKFS